MPQDNRGNQVKKSVRWWLFVDAILIGIILAHAMPANGQTLQPVSNGSGFGVWAVIIIGVAVVAVAGMIIWHKRNPSEQAKAVAEAHTALANAFTAIHEFVAKKEPTTPMPDVFSIGKNGSPGRFAIEVTGDPRVDLPAINAQYFG